MNKDKLNFILSKLEPGDYQEIADLTANKRSEGKPYKAGTVRMCLQFPEDKYNQHIVDVAFEYLRRRYQLRWAIRQASTKRMLNEL